MDLIKVKNLDQATTYLESFTLKHSSKWTTTFEEGRSRVIEILGTSTTADEVEGAVNDLIQQQFTLIQNESTDALDDDLCYTCVESYITAQLHDVVFGALCAHLDRHDNQLRERCLDGINLSTGRTVVPLTAAIVELSNLDAHTTALEKLACLCNAHDLVYAELKVALIELEADNEIGAAQSGGMVVVEREEVVALLTAVIARSKPQHMYTNLYYVQAFGACLFNNSITRQIYEDFSAAVERLAGTKTASTDLATPMHQRSHLELSDIVQLAAFEDNQEPVSSANTLLHNHRKRLLNLITTATTERL